MIVAAGVIQHLISLRGSPSCRAREAAVNALRTLDVDMCDVGPQACVIQVSGSGQENTVPLYLRIIAVELSASNSFHVQRHGARVHKSTDGRERDGTHKQCHARRRRKHKTQLLRQSVPIAALARGPNSHRGRLTLTGSTRPTPLRGCRCCCRRRRLRRRVSSPTSCGAPARVASRPLPQAAAAGAGSARARERGESCCCIVPRDIPSGGAAAAAARTFQCRLRALENQQLTCRSLTPPAAARARASPAVG
jgi:hypothetical protein